ncbi:hypothetical protein TCAL_09688 [Tigriopus californicus]|uniref:FAS1 domain-containing protein n=1 Tax=Tigriopus californicus TaxID=6832 RepID=A0A553NZ04_TIGCA|nr:hypothetical protein TCAL_09688 [Tigriopus californicus]
MIRVCQVALALALVLSVHGYSSKGKPNLVQLAKQLGLSEFVERLEDSAIDHIINHEGFFTIFAPSNDAFKNEMTYPDEAPIKSKMLFHIGRGKIYAKDIKNEMTVKSLLSKRRIRLNTYSNGKVTANGRVISSTDHEARNGVIHIIDDVMSSVYDRAGSIVSELDDCCPQHSIVLGLIKDAKLYDKLNTRGPLTFLAPNNGAFNELHPDFIIHLKKNITALRTFIAGHVLPGTLYSPGLQDGMMVKTFRGNQVKVTIAGNGKMAFNDAQVTLPDVTAGNGAVQAIDAILSPHKNKRMIQFDIYKFNGKETVYLANGREINFLNAQAHNGIVHELKTGMDFIYGRNGTLLDELSAIPRFSQFVQYMKDHSMGPTLVDTKNKTTLLAVNNKLFNQMKETLSEPEFHSRMSLNHVFRNTWYTLGLFQTDFIEAMSGKIIMITKNNDGDVMFDEMYSLIASDFTCRNGVFHEVDGIL